MAMNRKLLVLAACLLGVFGLIRLDAHMRAARVASVREHGSHVMPFDLDRTIHTFAKTETGGVERVEARDPEDAEQIALIREHLRAEAEKFSGGNFEDPIAIHGADMPGVEQLARNYARIHFNYSPLPAGARIEYRATSPEDAPAIHAFFDAQLMDHGPDAKPE